MIKQNNTGTKRTYDVLLRNAAFVFMIGFLLYHLFPFPPLIWRVGLVILSIMGLYTHARLYPFYAIEKAMLAFVGLIIVHFFVSFLWQVPETTNFGNVLCSTLPMFLFFVLSVRGVITNKSLLVFLIIASLAGIEYFRHTEEMILYNRLFGEEGSVTNNASTIFLVIIPFLFFVKNKYVVFAIMAEILFFLLLGAKRGNIVACVIPFILLFLKNALGRSKIITKIFFLVGFIGILMYAYDQAVNNEYLMNRYEDTLEGDSSGRYAIYSRAIDAWGNAPSFAQFFFGQGTDATLSIIGIRAHNDWLEILVDFGLLGAVLYFAFFVSMSKTIWRFHKNKEIFYVLLSVFSIWFIKTLFSMGFTNNIFSYLSMAIGIVLGEAYVHDHSKKIKK